MVIAIDGPAGAGKSTIARLIARKLNFVYLDTGAMYRALTLKVIQEKVNSHQQDKIIKLAGKVSIDLKNTPDGNIQVFLDTQDVTKEIRDPSVTKIVSNISKIPQVRKIMVNLQRKLGQKSNSVLEGRDIGTVVFPDAQYKFYLDAHIDERTQRRHKELIEQNKKIDFDSVNKDLKNRDTIDSSRKVGPLKKAEDAIYIDTTNLNIDQVVEKTLSYIKIKNE